MTAATLRLLAPDEPPAVIEYNAAGASRLLLVCDHAGRRIPRRLHDLGLNEADRLRHIAWDIGIAGVGRELADRLDARLVMQPYSRLVIDCNRPPGTPESIVVESEGTRIAGNENLSAPDAELRRGEIFLPYHDTIARHLDARKKAQRPAILISLHSFTPIYAGFARPWQIGVLYNRHHAFSGALLALLRGQSGLTVGDNEPYTVDDETDYTIPVHGERRGIPHVAIEIRQDLIGEDTGQRYWAERLAGVLAKAAEKIA
ncbi:MAG: N-formylglutamate amidohydrolase [Pseudolabrys sp.]